MDRREFITLLAAAVAVPSLVMSPSAQAKLEGVDVKFRYRGFDFILAERPPHKLIYFSDGRYTGADLYDQDDSWSIIEMSAKAMVDYQIKKRKRVG